MSELMWQAYALKEQKSKNVWFLSKTVIILSLSLVNKAEGLLQSELLRKGKW